MLHLPSRSGPCARRGGRRIWGSRSPSSGIVTFKRWTSCGDKPAGFPLERILVETDSSYLAPAGQRGKPETGPPTWRWNRRVARPTRWGWRRAALAEGDDRRISTGCSPQGRPRVDGVATGRAPDDAGWRRSSAAPSSGGVFRDPAPAGASAIGRGRGTRPALRAPRREAGGRAGSRACYVGPPGRTCGMQLIDQRHSKGGLARRALQRHDHADHTPRHRRPAPES